MKDTQRLLLEVMSGARGGLGGTLARAGLRALSAPYRVCVGARGSLYQWGFLLSRELEAIVISVGNLTAGGTGKTPMVIWLARWLSQRGVATAILSRGYGPTGPEGAESDETLLFRRHVPKVPHLVGKDRYASGLKAIAAHNAECLILDDGFQHLAVARDLDIVLVDSLLPWGYGHVLPRGMMREPLRSLRRADVVVLTRCDLSGRDSLREIQLRIRDMCGYRPVVESAHRPVRFYRHVTEESRPLQWVRGRRVCAFSALGNPDAFPHTLASLGAEVVEHRAFRDHHWYSGDDLASIARAAADAGVDAVVTTEKDAVKIDEFPGDAPPLYVLAVEFAILQGEELLAEILEQVVQG